MTTDALGEFMEEFNRSGAAWLHDKLLSLQASFHTFDRNCRDLNTAIKLHCITGDNRGFGDFFHRDQLNESLLEVARLLHNYLAGSKSLLDHTRVFLSEAFEPWPEVRIRIQQETRLYFEQHPVAAFTKDFRNLAQHSGIPMLSSVTPFRGPVYLALNVERLGQKRPWSVASKAFLAQAKEGSMELSAYVRSYHSVVGYHYQWLLRRCRCHFGDSWTFAEEFFQRWEEIGERVKL